MAGESEGDSNGGGGGGGGAGEIARCVRCDLEYNRDDRCPRVLLCGHTCCTACLDDLITEDQKRCPTCNRHFFTLSVVLIPKNLEVLNGAEKSSRSSSSWSSGSSQSSKSSYRSPLRSSLSSNSSLEVQQGSEKSSQSSKSSYRSPLRSSLSSDSNLEVLRSSEKSSQSLGSSQSARSSYSSPLRSSLSSDPNLEVLKSSEKSSQPLGSSQSSRSSYSSPLRSSLSSDSNLEMPKGSQRSSQSSESWRSSQSSKSSISSSFTSSYDSSLERPKTSRERSSFLSSLRSSSSQASSLEVRGEEDEGSERGEGGEGDVSGSSSGALSPPPVPSSAPPSLQESYSDLSASEVSASASEVHGGGASGGDQDLSGGGGGGGGAGGSGMRSSILHRSPTADQASGGSYAPPAYSFPTIRTKLNINGSRKPENEGPVSSISSGKAELRPAKSLPLSSSSSSSSSWSLPPMSSSLSQKEEESPSSLPASSGYTSPFLKSSSSSSFSSLKTNTFRSVSSESQKLSSRDNAATDSEKEAKNTTPSSSSSYSSPFRTKTFRSLSSESQKQSLRDATTKDSENETKNKTPSTSSYSSLSSSTSDATDGSSLSRSLPSLHKLEARLSVPPPAQQQDEVDRGVSRWKMEIPTSLSRKTDAKDAASRRTEGLNAAYSSSSSSSRTSGTPSHVLRMIRSVTSKTRAADGEGEAANQASEAGRSLSSYREAASSSSSSLITSKNTHTRHESGQSGQEGATTQQVSQSSAAPEASPAGTATPAGVSDRPSGSVSQSSSAGPDGGAEDASEGHGGMRVLGRLGGEAEAVRHTPAAAPPTGSRGEESKDGRKLALSASLSARLGARTRFLATAIDEASEEEEHAGGGESSAGARQARTGREDKLYKPDRQGVQQQQQQPARARVSLGARISARVSYLSGGRSGGGAEASRGEVQAEDSTKIDLQRRAGRAGTKDEAAEGGRGGTPSEGHGAAGAAGAAGAHLATGGDAAGDVEAKPRSADPAQSWRPSVLRNAGDQEGDGALPGAASSGRGDPPDVRGSAAPTHESSQHTRWRRHRPIDSRAKEELSDPGCVPRAAADHTSGSTSTGLPEAPADGASTPNAPPDAGLTAATAAAPAVRNQHGADAAPRRHYHRWTKRNDTSDGPSPVFRSEAGSATDTSGAAEREPGTGGGHEGGKAGTPPPLPSSGPYPWRKKWRSVTEHTSSVAARHTPPGANNTALSSTSKQPEEPPPPSSPPPPGEAPGEKGGSEVGITPSYRASLGSLAIGRVPSVQETDGGGGGDGDKAVRRGKGLGAARTRPRQASEDTPEDINARLRQARERLRATTTTPTEEDPPPGPARTNLTYLLRRVQGSEATVRTTRKITLSDEDDEVFEDSEDDVDGDKHPKQPGTPPPDSPDGGLEAERPEIVRPPTKPTQEEGHGWEAATDEVDSVMRRRNHQHDRQGQRDRENGAQEELHDRKPRQGRETRRQRELNDTKQQNGETTEQRELVDTTRQQNFEETQQTSQQEQDGARGTDEDTPDAPYEAPPRDYGFGDAGEGEYEPGVGLCSSHGLMLDLYCQDCEEWVCRDCLRVLHRPRPNGSCEVISAAEGVSQIKITHSSFLTSRSNTLEYFRAELRRIINECNGSINLHKGNIRQLEGKIEEERRLLRGIKSMRNLAKEKMRNVDYWEEVLKDNLSRIDESSTSQDVIRAVQESSGDILRKAMEAVSVEAGAGVLLSPPN